MKKFESQLGTRVALAAGFMLLTAAAHGQAPASPPATAQAPVAKSGSPDSGVATSTPPNQVVLKVGDQQVTADDLDFIIRSLNAQEQRNLQSQPNAKETLGNNYAITLVLEQQALRDHLDQSPDIRRQEALERTQRLAQAEYEKLANETTVSGTEVIKYFSDHPKDFEQVEVREVGIRTKPATAKPGDPGLTDAEAKTRAGEIRKALAAPGADPKKVAKDFTVANVVYVDPNTRSFQRGQLPAEIDSKLFAAKDGDITDPLNTQQQSIVFFQVIKQAHEPQVKDVQANIESMLKQQKLKTAVEALKSKTTIWLSPDYFKSTAAPQAPAPASPKPGATPTPQP